MNEDHTSMNLFGSLATPVFTLLNVKACTEKNTFGQAWETCLKQPDLGRLHAGCMLKPVSLSFAFCRYLCATTSPSRGSPERIAGHTWRKVEMLATSKPGDLDCPVCACGSK